MVSSAAKRKARVRQPVTGRERQAVQRVGRMAGRRKGRHACGGVAAGLPLAGVWLWPDLSGVRALRVREEPSARGPEWSPAELRRALWIAIAITVAGLLLGTLIAAWAGGAIPGPARLFGMMRLFVRPIEEPPAESPGEPLGRSPARPGALPERPSPGYPAPGIDCKTTSGERVRLGDCMGDVVLLTFFGTASGASLAHVSVLAEMHAEALVGARILAVAVSQAQDAVVSYMEARKLDLPVIADPRGELAQLYDITAVPTTFVIDAQGIVRDLRVGAMTRAQLERAVRSAF